MLSRKLQQTIISIALCITSAVSAQTFEQEVVQLVNLERLNNGNLAPLKHVDLLDQSSENHSVNMADRDFFAHCDLDTGEQLTDRLIAVGYNNRNYWAENIAAGYANPAAVMAGWMTSSGHRSNILSINFREIGVGYFNPLSDANNVRLDADSNCVADGTSGPFYRYWTQNFGSRFGIYPLIINREALQTSDYDVDLYIYGPSSAVEMRFRNEANTWSAWQTFNNHKAWTLSAAGGTKTVEVRLRNNAGSLVSQQSDTIFSDACSITTEILNLAPQTISGIETYQACAQINAGDDSGGLVIEASADVLMQASKIVLAPGFTVETGARFHANTTTP